MNIESLARSTRTQGCDLCSGNDFRIVANQDRRKNHLPTVLCTQCGLVSHEEIPTDAKLNAYYAAEYRQDYHGEFLPSPHRVVRAWNGANWLFDRLSPHLNPGASVFEIGAGIGCTVKRFEIGGFPASGIEPGEGFSQFAQSQLHADVQADWLFDLNFTSKFDLVLLVHVIEHFQSPRQALETIHQYLNPRGLLYVECPNVAGPHAAPGKQFHFAHIHNFTHDTLEMMAESCGYEVVERIPVDRELTLRYVLRRRDSCEWTLRPESPVKTISSLFRYNTLTYHLRPAYWFRRIERDIHFAAHRFRAEEKLSQILRQCQKPAASALQAA